MKSVLLVIVLLHSALATEGLITCSQTSVRCINSNQYVFCIKNFKGEGVLVGNVLSCPDNTICDENSWFPCVRLATTAPPSPTTIKPERTTQKAATTLKPSTPPESSTTLKPTTTPEPTTLKPTTTPEETTLKPNTLEPIATKSSTTQKLTTTKIETVPTLTPATTLPPIQLPDCSQTGAGKYPSALCNEYLECVKDWWWYDLNRVSCPENQLYDTTLRKCAPSETVECLQRTV